MYDAKLYVDKNNWFVLLVLSFVLYPFLRWENADIKNNEISVDENFITYYL